MSIFKKKKILVTHDGTFHADDLFATATLSVLNNGNIEIIRTRDSKLIAKGDYVYDVGGISDEKINRFDHHQKEGGGVRENGIPYASFGLVWKAYGEQICGSKEVVEIIDKKLVQAIDAVDNGIDVSKRIFEGVSSKSIAGIFINNIPTWKEDSGDINKIFKDQTREAAKFLVREIEVTKAFVEGKNIILKNYENSEDKRIVMLDINFPRYLYQDTLSALPEPIYVIMPHGFSGQWKIEAITKSPETIESRKLFPESWRGFTDSDPKLKEITGIPDIIFCHRSGFLAHTQSKEGAIELARKALIA